MFNFLKNTKQSDSTLGTNLTERRFEENCRAKITKAIQSLNINIEQDLDNTRYGVESTLAVVRKIMDTAGVDMNDIAEDEDDIFTGGLFCLILSSHITRVVKSEFEIVSAMAIFNLLFDSCRKHTGEYVPLIINLYAQGVDNNREVINAVGQNFVEWIENPTDEHFVKTVGLYHVCKKSIAIKE